MSFQQQIYTTPPIPPQLANARTFQDLREGTKQYLSMLGKYHFDTFNGIVKNANLNTQGLGQTIASAATITVTQSLHDISGTAKISTIIPPKGFQGMLMLMALTDPGFTLSPGGNIDVDSDTLVPSYTILCFQPARKLWFTSSYAAGDNVTITGKTKIGMGGPYAPTTYPAGALLYGNGSAAIGALADVAVGSYLRSGGAGATPLWSTLKLPNAAAVGDLLLATAANSIASLPDVAAGQVLASGGVGVVPAYTDSPTLKDVTASGTVQTATLNVTTHVTQGGGLKHQRVTTGAIAASTSADVTLTWTAAFADANYTPSASVIEASASLRVIAIKSISATQVVVTVHNDDAGAPHTGTLAVIALHD